MRGLTPGEIARARMEALGLRGDAAAGRDNLALLKECIGDRDRLIEQPAGIVAQIDNEALELIAGLGSEVGNRFFQAIRGLLVELSNANEADIITVHPRADRAQADEFARNRNFKWLVLAVAHNSELDLGIHGSLHHLNSLIKRESLHRLFTEMCDDVIWHDAGLRRWRSVDWSHHPEHPLL